MFLLERMLALLLSITIIPLRSLYHNSQFAVKALFYGVLACIGIPVRLGIECYRAHFSLVSTVALTLFVFFPIAALLETIGFVCIALYLIGDLFTVTWQGLKNSFLDGMTGFLRSVRNPILSFEDFLLQLRTLFLNEERINTEDFNALELVDVVVPQNNVAPDMQDAAPHTSTDPLQDFEIKLAEDVVKDSASLNIALPLDIKKNIEQLKVGVERYKDLSKRLALIKEALNNNRFSDIQDQLILYNEVEVPVLLVKQYQENEVWHIVPSNSYVTDKESLLKWLKTQCTHPLNRDSIKNPPEYKNMPTRYRWHELTAQNCYAQELGEGAEKIRNLSKIVPEQLNTLKLEALKNSQGGSSQAFFGKSSLPEENSKEIESTPRETNICTGSLTQ